MLTTRRLALGALFLGVAAIGTVYGATLLRGELPPWAPWLMALGTAATMVATMMLGAARDGRPLGALALAFAFTFVVLAGGFALALALPAAHEPLWLGVPRRAAVLLYGVGLVPLLVLPLAYARTFDDASLAAGEVARIRALRPAEVPGDEPASARAPSR